MKTQTQGSPPDAASGGVLPYNPRQSVEVGKVVSRSVTSRYGAGRALAFALTGTLAFAAPVPASRANGWEHAVIPFEALLAGLSRGDAETRRRAAVSLGVRRQPEATGPLLSHLEAGEPDPEARRAAYRALGLLGDPRGTGALAACLAHESRDEIRGECAGALGRIGGQRALGALIAVFARGGSILVRAAVVDALGGFDAPGAVHLLTEVARAPRGASLRVRAIRALGRTGSPAAAPVLLERLAGARDDRERIAVVGALGRLGAREAVRPLSRLLERSDDLALRLRATTALGAIRDGTAVPALAAMLEDPDPAVRFFAIEALREVGRSAAGPPLARALGRALDRADGAPREGRESALARAAALSEAVAAIRTLSEIAPGLGAPLMLRAARVRAAPRDSGGAMQVAEGIYEMRRAALYGLGYAGDPEAASLLEGTDGLRDPDPRLRAVATRSRAVLGGAGAGAALVPMLADPAAEVRWAAALALGRLREPAAVAGLARMLAGDRWRESRRRAAEALGLIGAAEGENALAGAARGDPDPGVRAAAALALERVRSGNG